MGTGANKSLYGADEGWESDPDLFAQVAVTSSQWFGQAGDHLYAAQVFLPHVEQRHLAIRQAMEARQPVRVPPSLTDFYFLHCAFCLENAFKGVIAMQFSEEIRERIRKTKELPKLLLGHDLVKLAARAGFQIGIDEEHTLVFLSRYGTWAGRYPLSVQNADYSPTRKLSDGKHYLVGGYGHHEVPGFVAFCGRVYEWAKAKAQTPATSNPVTQQS
jgi:hypothetical protein